MKTSTAAILVSVLCLTGCAEIFRALETRAPAALTEQEVVNGLKEALVIGARNASGRLAVQDGYYGDLATRILLPDEARVIVENISRLPGGDRLVDDVVVRINRAAEDAAKEVAPIFVSAVTRMTIADAFGILRGEHNAATDYLRRTAGEEIYALYRPRIAESTGKKIVGDVSTRESWDALTGAWNSFANSVAGRLAGFNTVSTDLDDFLTRRALEVLFAKVEEEERAIRTDISARVTPLLRRVFGAASADQDSPPGGC